MRAVMCRAWGPIDDLIVEDVAPPTPGRGQVVINVHATGVNYADSIMVAGRYQTRPTLPFSPGLEAAGVVTQCGDGVTRYKPGDHVMAAASTDEKLAVARERGADELINYATEKLTDRVMALTDGKGANVCFDPIGGDLFDAALSSLGWGGRILLIGFVAGVPNIPANRLLVKHRSALGSSLRYFRWHEPDKLRRTIDELLQWYATGQLKPCVTHRLPLERTVEAIRLLTDRKAHGKIVVMPELPAR